MTPLVSSIIAALLTAIVLSRIFGDTPLFRAAQYLFVGVSLGYVFVVLYYQVLLPGMGRVLQAAAQGNIAASVVQAMPFLLLLLLLPRIAGPLRLSWLANFPLGLIFGVGVGLSLAGALIGTIVPQMLATVSIEVGSIALIAGSAILLLGVIFALNSFFFTSDPATPTGRLITSTGKIGRWLLIFAFGFFLAGALVTYLTALNERFNFLVSLFR